MAARRKKNQTALDLPAKANQVLHVILIALLLIVLRIWYLTVVQHEQKVEEAKRPQRKTVLEPAKRGTIRDRFLIPLAINKIQYNASLLYSPIRQIPYASWEVAEDGTRVRRYKRKEHISQLADLLSKELNTDRSRLEDLIYSKAAFQPHIPFVMKEDLTEKEYYRLKMLEKDWVGLQVQQVPKRDYPLGRTGADIIGYMGAINRESYQRIIEELHMLEEWAAKDTGIDTALPDGYEDPQFARKRLKTLREYAYRINDYVGKTGIEAKFEEDLRGFQGKKIYASDARGRFTRELPGGKEPAAGSRIVLTLSAELQEFAEKLLTQDEETRQPKLENQSDEPSSNVSKPWIKGGAIIVMDPNTADLIAMASYPRFDPNDFISSNNPENNQLKNRNIRRWLESEEYVGEIWDQKRPLEKEWFDAKQERFYENTQLLTWNVYLSSILPDQNAIFQLFKKKPQLETAIEAQNSFETLLQLSGQSSPQALLETLFPDGGLKKSGQEVRGKIQARLADAKEGTAKLMESLLPLFKELPRNSDKLLYLDLCRVAVNGSHFRGGLKKITSGMTVEAYRQMEASLSLLEERVQQRAKGEFHATVFAKWRQENEKEFLAKKRAEEKATRQYAKPYLDYLDTEEKILFRDFWMQNREELIALFLLGDKALSLVKPENVPLQKIFAEGNQDNQLFVAKSTLKRALNQMPQGQRLSFLSALRVFSDLNRPLYGSYPALKRTDNQQLEKHLAQGFYPKRGFGYGRSQCYRQATTQGSVFKLVTAYEALKQLYLKKPGAFSSKHPFTPFEIVDQFFRHGKDQCVGYHADGKPIPRFYKGGRLPRSLSKNLGRLDLVKAIETSSNPYFALLASDVLESPEDLARVAKEFSYGSRTGIELPGEIAGSIPKDLSKNRTGLYSMAIGQHSLVVTPLQTSVMLSALANGGKVLEPKIVCYKVRWSEEESSEKIPSLPTFPYQEQLLAAGIDFPLFTSALKKEEGARIFVAKPTVKRELFMPKEVRRLLLEGMARVVLRDQSRGMMRLSPHNAEALQDYVALKSQLLGKTSTAESIERMSLDAEFGTQMINHVWFGGIAFDKDVSDGTREAFCFHDESGKPEAVVVVYLRYAVYGKEAAPLAARMVQKWREIKRREAEAP